MFSFASQILQELTESSGPVMKAASNHESNGSVSSTKMAKEDANGAREASSPAVSNATPKSEKKEESNAGKKSPELEVKSEPEAEEIDMSGESSGLLESFN